MRFTRLPRHRLLVVGALIGSVIASCDAVLPVPNGGVTIEDLDTEPRPGDLDWEMDPPTGPVVQVMSGTVDDTPYQMIVHATRSGVCIAYGGEASSGGACGAIPGSGVGIASTFGMLGWSGGDESIVEVNGMAASSVDRVWVETSTGERANATLVSLRPADLDAQAFVAFLPSDVEPLAVVAETGDTVERVELARP